MKRNTGKSSEKLWVDMHSRLGKRAYCVRFVDAAEIKAKTGKVAQSASAQPADYLRVLDGEMALCEVKSTANPLSFPFNLLKPTQHAAAKQTLAAGGQYYVFVHSLVTDQWYCIPYSVINATAKSSLKWTELTSYLWSLN